MKKVMSEFRTIERVTIRPAYGAEILLFIRYMNIITENTPYMNPLNAFVIKRTYLLLIIVH